jgi:arginine/lysine/ornithine decarboxylase
MKIDSVKLVCITAVLVDLLSSVANAFIYRRSKFNVKVTKQCRNSNAFILNEKSMNNNYISSLLRGSEAISHRFFFPGHGGNGILAKYPQFQFVESMDLPELDETDNIHSPQGPLLQSLQITSSLFRSRKSWFLVNGSTSGILIALLSLRRIYLMRTASRAQDNIVHSTTHTQLPVLLVPRDSHKSVYDALALFDIDAILIDVHQSPTLNVALNINLDAIRNAIEQYGNRIMGLILTRPSYQGVLTHSKIFEELVSTCHQHNIPVVADEAHGAHLRFLPKEYEIKDALSCGADIVVQSAHKSLMSLSQTALLHVHPGAFSFCSEISSHQIDEVLNEAYSSLTTTSPNSILIASLDVTISFYQQEGKELVRRQCKIVEGLKYRLRKEVSDVVLLIEDCIDSTQYQMNPIFQTDPTRLSLHVIRHPDCTWNSIAFDDALCEGKI